MAADLKVTGLLDFAATVVEFVPLSERAREYVKNRLGSEVAPLSFRCRKSEAAAWVYDLEAAGLETAVSL